MLLHGPRGLALLRGLEVHIVRSEDDGHPLAVYAIDDDGHCKDDDYDGGHGMGEHLQLQDRHRRPRMPQPEMGGKDDIGWGRGGGRRRGLYGVVIISTS
jgi:hypothetical protein